MCSAKKFEYNGNKVCGRHILILSHLHGETSKASEDLLKRWFSERHTASTSVSCVSLLPEFDLLNTEAQSFIQLAQLATD